MDGDPAQTKPRVTSSARAVWVVGGGAAPLQNAAGFSTRQGSEENTEGAEQDLGVQVGDGRNVAPQSQTLVPPSILNCRVSTPSPDSGVAL